MAGNLASQVAEQIAHMPVDIENPLAFAGFMGAAALASVALWEKHKNTDEKFKIDFRGEEALLNRSIQDVTGRPAGVETGRKRWSRMGCAVLAVVGLGLAAGSYAANMEYETTTPNQQANMVVVVDGSLSMLKTQDMGGDTKMTRLQAVKEGLSNSSYAGKAAVVEFAADTTVDIPLSQNWQQQVRNIGQHKAGPDGQAFDTNGGALTPALELAASLLPNTKAANSGTTKTRGDILLVSDGTIDDSPAKVTAEINKLKQQGVNVEVIVPGTPEGKYHLDAGSSSPVINSGINANEFNGSGKNKVVIAANEAAVTKAITAKFQQAGNTTERKQWLGLTLLGALMAAYGTSKLIWRSASRKV